jgi:hypothetical protein
MLLINPAIHRDNFYLTFNETLVEFKAFLRAQSYINLDETKCHLYFSRYCFSTFLNALITGAWINQRGKQALIKDFKRHESVIFPDFLTSTEESLLLYVDKLIATYQEKTFQDMHILQVVSKGKSNHYWYLSGFAIVKDWLTLAKKLLDNGARTNFGYISPPQEKPDCKTCLELALDSKKIEVAAVILTYNPDLLEHHQYKGTVLMQALASRSLDAVELIIENAAKRHLLHKLIALRNELNGFTVYELAVDLRFFEALEVLISIQDFHLHIDMKRFVHKLRKDSWLNSESHSQYNNIITRMRALLPSTDQPFTIPPATSSEFAYRQLFHAPSTRTSSKEEAIKLVIAQYYSLLLTPERCFKYLKYLNDELKRYYELKHAQPFPVLDRSTIETVQVESIPFPLPKDNFSGIGHKGHCLQRVLISILRRENLAKQCYEWEGFVPEKIANQHIKNGDFTIESPYGSGLFHGGLAHALQSFLLYCGWVNNEFTRTYIAFGQEEQLALADINAGFVTCKSAEGDLLWVAVRDYLHPKVSFATPFHVYPLIMFFGADFNCRELADVLMDSFAKSIYKCWRAIQSKPEFSAMSSHDFIEEINDFSLRLFTEIPVFKALTQEKIKRKQREVVKSGSHYTVIKREYNTNEHTFFQPRTYQEYKAEQLAKASTEPW